MLKNLFLPLFMFVALCQINAQTQPAAAAPVKYGHMNLGNLLEQLPDVKKANEALKAYTERLSAKDDSLVQAFQKAYTELEKQVNELPPVVLQQKQAELQKQQEFIQKFEEDAQRMVGAKRDEMLQPILGKIRDVVKVVAQENGYAMIFDVASGAMLFASETDDVTPLVKKKLGL
jgi:outer membrane protein